jgi:UDP-N-acetyl-2-amino-2-deoxyglucuronate dehydrogenase
MSNIRFAVIGYGHIGTRHAGIIAQHPDARLVAICDTDSRIKVEDTPVYSDHQSLLHDAKPDVVCVCTPNGLHALHSIDAIASGAHVICEKPLAVSFTDARDILSKATEHDKHLFCVLQNRYSPQIQWLKELINEGRLGDLYQVQVNCFWNRDERYYHTEDGRSHPWRGKLDLDGGPLYTQFSHFVDILIWLLPGLAVRDARFENFAHSRYVEFEDAGEFGFSWEGGGIGRFHYSIAVWDANQESSITLIGSQGSIRIGGQYMNHVEYCHVKDYTMPDLAPAGEVNDYGKYKGTANNHFFVIDNMIQTLRGQESPHFDLADAVRGVALIEEVYRGR